MENTAAGSGARRTDLGKRVPTLIEKFTWSMRLTFRSLRMASWKLVRCCSESCTRSLEPPFAVWSVGCVRALPLVPCSLGSVCALPLVPCSLGSVCALPLVPCSLGSVFALPLVPCSLRSVCAVPLVPCSLGSVCAVPLRFSRGCVCAPFVPCSLGSVRLLPFVRCSDCALLFAPSSLEWLRSAPLVPFSLLFWFDSLCAEDLPFGSLCCAPFSE